MVSNLKRKIKTKKLSTFLGIGLVFTLLFSFSTNAFAMGYKGDPQVAFHTDADVYSKSATTIDVIGKSPNSEGVTIELLKKGDSKFYKRIDLDVVGNYKASFSLKGLTSGKYDVHVLGGWGSTYWKAELTHYLTVNR
ncbi:hypothetical protein MXL46_00065 [Heyndrickxia sporothermodurans]|uniref:hypothetical protein n=1 Tax=Heyndrickxia sporothermodurans TaxID=46224 RepID=UPI002DBF209F|nr:hypothetical protein [Heyndrickxia sporothermodurans]MEB6547498.1 hypothetical protein [Heyndrickxia sporothermodurans]